MRQRPEQGSGRVLVLAGGLSHERDVSMRSGRRVTEALRHQGLDADQRDVDAALLPALQADPPSCVVPVVHGESGEDGALREVLELLHLPYVGAIPRACRFAFDKPVASALVEAAGFLSWSSPLAAGRLWGARW
jgi:D-alanine-D-alanine ligase